MENQFDSFPRPETAAWAEALRASLKNAEEASKFVHETTDGLKIKALYRAEDLPLKADRALDMPSQNEVGQWIALEKISAANARALEALNGGATWLWFEHVHQPSDAELDRLLENIRLDWGVPIYMDFGESTTAAAFLIPDYLESKGYDVQQLEGGFVLDPITRAARTGKFESSAKQSMQVLHQTLLHGMERLPKFRWLNIQAGFYREAGAGPVQELAFALALASDYLHHLGDAGLEESSLIEGMEFRFHQMLSADYFSEIAKLRAFRVLWANLLEQRGQAYQAPLIHVQPGLRNKTLFDPHNNLVRAALECMSAFTGGADRVSMQPYDHFFRSPDKASYRWARNVPLLVRDEARMGGLQDPGAGAYMLENLSQKMVEKAWGLFLEIEEKGGMIEALQANHIQQMISFNAAQEQQAFLKGDLVLVGSNAYVASEEKRSGDFSRILASEPEEPLQFLKIRPSRLSEGLEIERLKKETAQSSEQE